MSNIFTLLAKKLLSLVSNRTVTTSTVTDICCTPNTVTTKNTVYTKTNDASLTGASFSFKPIPVYSSAKNACMKTFVRKSSLFVALFIVANFFVSNVLGQTTITITSSTNWSAINTGSGPGGQPNSTDDIIVRNQAVLTVNVGSGTCKSITLGGGGSNNNGDLTFNASSQVTISGNLIFATITNRTNAVSMTAGGTLICQGFTVNGTMNSFTAGTGTVELTATNTLPASIFTTFRNLTISSGTTTLGVNTTILGNLTIQEGATLDETTRTLTLGSGSVVTVNGTLDFSSSTGLMRTGSNLNATLTMGANGLIRTVDPLGMGPLTNASFVNQGSGVWNMSSISTNGTVEYYGTSQAITDRDYNNLIVYNAVDNSTWTFGAGRTINGDLVNNSTLIFAGVTTGLTIKGDWENNYSFNNGGVPVKFNGSAQQEIRGSTLTAFHTLIVDNPATVLLGINTRVDNQLTFSSANSKIITGTRVLQLGNAINISGAGSDRYVYGNLRHNITSNGTVVKSFPIGDADTYAPIDLTITGAANDGSLTAFTVGSNDPNIATSTIDETKNVNRYWSIVNASLTFTNYSAVFNFVAADVDGGASTSNFIVGKYTGTTWSYPTVGTKTATSTQATGLTAFSTFAVGEGGAAAPTMNTQPTSQTVCIPTAATFTAKANSIPPSTVVWEISTNGGGSWGPLTISSPYSVNTSSSAGVTTSVLTIDPTSSGLNNYRYRAVFTNSKGSITSSAAILTVNTAPLADDPADVTRCDSYTLPALTNGNYFTGAGGTGTALSAGATITSTQTIYVYNPGTAPCLPAENSFLVTINNTPLADDPDDVVACGSYALPALTNGNYFSSPGGVGPLSAGDIMTTGITTIYVYAAGTAPCASVENSFTVTVNPIPTANISYSGSPYCKAGKAFVNQTGQGGGTYSFTPAGLSIGATGDVDLELSTAGTYTVTYSFSNGNCSSTTSTTIVINPLPACSITGTDGPVCPSSNNNYSAPAGMSTYAWSLENANGATFTTATNIQNVTVKAGAGCNTSYKLKLTITDANNCSSTCEKTVTVQDLTKPTITQAASNGSVECGSLATPTLNTWLNNHGGATATDGCTGAGQLVWTNNFTSLSNDCGNTGSATVTFRVTDACGNYEETTATFSVVDNTDPTWTSTPANLTVECDGSGNETALNDWLNNTFAGTDNCGFAFVSNNFTSLSNGCGATGSATVIFVLTDECGNSISKNATFTILDTEKPSATAGTIASCYPTVAAAEAAAIAATTSSDACAANNELTVTAATVGSCNAVITVTVTDPCGNARNVTYNTKIDNTVPVITSTSVTATALGCNPTAAEIEAALGGATASDNCDGDITTSILPATDAAIVNGCQYSQTRRWNVADACGNNAVEVTRTVTWKVDLTAPVLSEQPASTTAECNNIPTAPVVTASDVCDGAVTVSFNETSTKGTDAAQCSFYNYIIYRAWSAADACGNTTTHTQTITVSDNTNPTVDGNDIASCYATVAAAEAAAIAATTYSDNCAANANLTVSVSTSGTCSAIITVTVKDPCNNSGQYIFYTKIDNTIPVITATSETATALGCNPSAATIEAALGGATASDNCDGDITASIVPTTDDVIVNGCMRSQTRRWNVADACGNNAVEVTRTVTWKVDMEAPVIIATNAAASTDLGCNPTATVIDAALGGATASDNCDGDITASIVPTTDNEIVTGCYRSQTRRWNVEDGCGNDAIEVTRTVTWKVDVTAPVITANNAAAPTNLSCNPFLGQIDAALGGATANDNCDGNITSSIVTTTDPVVVISSCRSSQTRRWNVSDACGNPALEVTRTVTWRTDLVIPVITVINAALPTDLGCNPTASQINGALGAATASDNCDGNLNPDIIATTDAVVVDGCMRSQTRRWNVKDGCNNYAEEVSRTVTWKVDTEAPVITATNAAAATDLGCNPTAAQIDAALGGATASDNCDGDITADIVPATDNEIVTGCYRSQTRRWNVEDGCGNDAVEVTRTVTWKVDLTAPVLSGQPANTTAECNNIPTVPSVTASDVCDGAVTVNFNETSTKGTDATQCSFYNYVIYRAWSAADACGNSTTHTQTITVSDNTKPTVSTNDIAICYPTVAAAEAAAIAATTYSDNCAANTNLTVTASTTGTCNGVVTVTVTDPCGNSNAVTYNVRIDNSAPVLSGQPAATVAVQCDAVPTAAVVTALDNCQGVVPVNFTETSTKGTDAAQCSFYTYTIYRAWSAADACGNTSTFTQTIAVSDDTAPVLTVPADANAECSSLPGAASATDASATDNCDQAPTVTYVGEVSTKTNNGTCSDQHYTITRTWKAEDKCGNSSTKSQVITISDNTAPVLTVPANASAECSSLPIAGVAGDASATDNCDSEPTVTYVGEVSTQTNNGTCSDQNYTLTRTWKAVDNCGNSSTKSQVITISDNTAPVLTVPADANAECSSLPPAGVAGDASAIDNCDATPTVTYVGEVSTQTNNGTCSDQNYTITRTWKAEDNCGNSSTKKQVITVSDNTAPLLTVPANASMPCDIPISPATAADASATDNCDATPDVTYLGEVSTKTTNGTCSDQNYTITRTWKAEDNCGNSTILSQVITVSDTKAPVLTVPASTSAECDAVPAAATAGDASAEDNCDATPTVTYLGETSTQTNDGSCSDQNYTITRTWKAEDNCGNSSFKSQTITISDTKAPVLTVPANTTAECSALPAAATAANASALDNCDQTPTVTYLGEVSTKTNNGTCSDQNYTLTRTWKAEDNCGNSSTKSQVITVSDNTAPVLTVPANASAECDEVPETASAADASAIDNCDATPTVTYLGETTTQTGIGTCGYLTYTITRTWKAEDNCGNSTTKSQTITITDNTAPVLTGVPASTTVSCDAIPVVPTVTANDNCNATVAVNFATSNTKGTDPSQCSYYNYIIYRAWSAADACGNTTTQTQTLTVVDAIAPTGNSPTGTANIDACAAGASTAVPFNATEAAAGYTDNCGSPVTAILTNTQVTGGDCGWTLTYTYKVKDVCGNELPGQTVVHTGSDKTVPTAVAKNITVQLNAAGTVSITAAQVNNGSSDLCTAAGNLTLQVTPSTFTCANVGPNVVTFKVIDACGNSSFTTATVTVQDVTPPTAVCQNITVNLDASGNAVITPAMINNGSTDACGIQGYSLSKTAFTCADLVASTPITNLFISEYIEGSSNNKAIEIYNGTGTPVNLGTGGYVLKMYFNGATTSTDFALTGTIANGDVFVFAASTANAAILAQADQTTTLGIFNGDDAIALYKGSTLIDVIGQIGNDPGAEWGTGLTSTADNTIRRKSTIKTGDTNGADVFDPSVQWDGLATDDFSGLGSHSVVPGGTPVTLTVTDVNGNSSTCTAFVTVKDLIAPTVTTAAGALDVTLQCSDASGIAAAVAALPNATDNCGTPTRNLLTDVTSPGCGTTFTRVRTWNFSDASGNTSTTFTQTITVIDNTAPVVLTKNITIQLSAGGTASITAAQVNNGSSDNCTTTGNLTLSVTPSNFTCLNVGSNTVTLKVTDQCGNSSTNTAIVTVQDVTPPTAVCQNVTVYLDANGQASLTPAQVNNGSSDICGIQNLSLSKTTFDCSNVSVSTPPTELFISEYIEGSSNSKAIEIYNGTGAPINLNTGGYVLRVYSNGSTSFTSVALTGTVAAGDVYVIANGSSNAAILAQADQTSAVIAYNGNDAVALVKGTTIIDVVGQIGNDPGTEWGSGLTSTADNTLRRKSSIKTGDNNGSDTFDPSIQWDGFATDNSANLGAHTYTFVPTPVIVTLTVTDVNGNSSTCTANITVLDQIAPIITNAAGSLNATLECSNTVAIAAAIAAAPTATDNCGPVTIHLVSDVNTPGCGTTYTRVRTWNFTDPSGNTSLNFVQTIVVTDNTAPTLSLLPASTTVQCDAVPSAPTVTASDNCDASITVNFNQTSTKGTNPALCSYYSYTIYRAWSAADACGNTTTHTQTITVIDDSKPTVTAGSIASCYATVTAAETAAKAATTYSDNCATNANLVVTASTVGDCSAVITVKVTDPCGNFREVTYNTRIDNTVPVFSEQPASATVQCDAVPSVPTITANDNCDGAVTVNFNQTSTKGVDPAQCSYYSYIIYRAWSATDACGNTTTYTQTLTVIDNTKPTVTAGTINSCYPTVAAAQAAAVAATTYSDNCAANANLTVVPSTVGTCSAVVTVRVTDPCGNFREVTYNTRIDNTAPVLSVQPASTTVQCDNVPSVPIVTANDNCDGAVTVNFDQTTTKGTDPAQCSYYSYIIYRAWSAADACGNTTTHTQTITVIDNTAPVITVPANIVVNYNPAECGAIVAYVVTATDNCAGSITPILETTSYPSESTFPLGTTWVTHTAIDPCGNSSTRSFSVTVNAAPTTSTLTVTPTTQQYSDTVRLKVVIENGASLCSGPNAATSATFTINGQVMKHPVSSITNIPFVVNGNNLEAILTTPLLDYVDNFANGVMKPGSKTVSAVINGIAPEFAVGQPTNKTLTVTQEDARIVYTGDLIKATATATTTSAPFALRANIYDITAITGDPATDGTPGDIRNARARFVLVNGSSITPIGGWRPITLVDALDKKVGSISFDTTLSVASGGYQFFTIGVEVNNGGYYFRNKREDDVVLTVYQPTGDFITGGGCIVPSQSAGEYASDAGQKVNFGFNVKFNKKGTNLQGNMNIIFRKTMPDNLLHSFQIKANAMQSLGVNVTDPTRKTAEYLSKVNLTDVTNPTTPVSIYGGVFLFVKMVDRGEPGVNDSISFVLVKSAGANTPSDPTVLANIIWSSHWVGSMTKLLNLECGNLVVHSGFSTGSAKFVAPDLITEAEKAEPAKDEAISPTLDVKVLGNPSETNFTLIPQGSLPDAITVRVTDAFGRVMEVKSGVRNGQSIRFGNNYRPGTYFAEIVQGRLRKVVMLIKQ